MKNVLWVISVFFFLIWIPPVLMIMMFLVLTEIPLINAFIYWTPMAIIGSIGLLYWYCREGEKRLEELGETCTDYADY